jgi:glycine/D-amino acid oxidase-like deaminating enzyme
MVRSLVDEPALTVAAIEGCRFWNELPEELDRPGMFRRSGSLLLAEGEEAWNRLQQRAAEARRRGLHPEAWSPDQVMAEFPLLDGCPMRGAIFSPEDGIADPAALIDAFLKAARHSGAQIHLGTEVEQLELADERGGCVVQLAGGEELRAEHVVLAAGAWVDEILENSDLPVLGLHPHKRHLYSTSSWDGLDPNAPFVWHVDGGAYFRPEGGGVLFSVCDERIVAPSRPELDESVYLEAGAKLSRLFPFLQELPIAHAWAGLRTYGAGGAFVLGPGNEHASLGFAAGLGGHGVTCAGAIGLQVAERVLLLSP